MKTRWRWLRRLLTVVCFGAVLLPVSGLVLLRALAPQTGEWSVSLPLAGRGFELGVPGLLRLATSSWVGPLLDGRRFSSRFGPVSLRWDRPTTTLQATCSPCLVRVAALGSEPLRLERLALRVRRDFDALSGTAEVGSGPTALRAVWQATLSQQSLEVSADAASSPIADWYAALMPTLPERSRASIDGTLALRLQVSLPTGKVSAQAVATGFAVGGLGTEKLARATSECGPPSGLREDSWLARSVIAAEDQRFAEHPGYDMAEMAVAVAGNQQDDRGLRGASTLTQQLAKLLMVGSERSADRKLRELLYAVEMERTLGKKRILQLYLDNVPWGEKVCGAEAAALHYFGVKARALEPRQAVWLASMLHAPDRAAHEWRLGAGIDVERARWVAQAVRGVPGHDSRQRRALADALGRPMPPAG